jgi:hypothetical protein
MLHHIHADLRGEMSEIFDATQVFDVEDGIEREKGEQNALLPGKHLALD